MRRRDPPSAASVHRRADGLDPDASEHEAERLTQIDGSDAAAQRGSRRLRVP
ncbi:MAG: hypothetical protein MZW92_40260 [Comamonadaceae bacterium]|nr:hypothetical protein [Comamonadaceae bacterium]